MEVETKEENSKYVTANHHRVHKRPELDTDEDYQYSYHPECGQRLNGDSVWVEIDTDSIGEAIVQYDLTPCEKCFR